MLAITALWIDHAPVTPSRAGHLTGSARPVISWAAQSDRTGDTQAEYRLTAGTWDSGWVCSSGSSARLPEGTLTPGVRTDVILQLRSAQGDASAPYQDWIIDARVDWDAPWISAADPVRDRPICFSKTFFAKDDITSARIYVCGVGYHAVSINGQPLDADAKLDPAHTDYAKRVQYAAYFDKAGLFRAGENEIRVTVAPGWRDNTCMHQQPDDALFCFEGPLQLSMIAELETSAHETLRIVTDETWQTGEGPYLYASLFNGVTYDASRCEACHAPAVTVPAPASRIEAMLIPPIIEKADHSPIAFWPDGEGGIVLDFGINMAGVLRLPLPGLKKGQRITLTHAEEITEDGRLFRDTLRNARQEDTYIASGVEQNAVWQPEFTYHGFRYACITGVGAGFDPRTVRAVELRTDVDAASFFTCGNTLITKIHELCVNTERANIHSILTDCPQRNERMGWMNDATVRFEETPYNFHTGRLFPKVIRDVMDTQDAHGAITCTAPFAWGQRPADPVCSAFLIAGYEAAMHTGNLDIVREAYPAYKAWEDYLLSRSDELIVQYSYYGDWAGPADCCVPGDGENPGSPSAVTPGLFLSTGCSYLNCRLIETFAKWLGREDDRQAYAALAERIRQAILCKWYDDETGVFATGSQACQAFALWLGIAPDAALCAKRLNEAVEEAGWRLTTGNLCSRYIMDALCDHGYAETAWRLMTREDYPSIGYMIQQEATTVWERFELMKASGMNSHCHPMYGAVDYWMYAYLAGIKCTDFGWRRFCVKPVLPEKLMSAQAAVETPLGRISARWTKRYGSCHLQLSVPFGAEADVDFGGVKQTVQSGFHTFTAQEKGSGS